MTARTCPVPRCPHIIPDGEKYRADCEQCRQRQAAAAPWSRKRERLSFYSSARWQKLRRHILINHPVCQVCSAALATEVDHIISASKDRPGMWYDVNNLQAICSKCHRAKTSTASIRSRREGGGI